jgi:hypothetical protein
MYTFIWKSATSVIRKCTAIQRVKYAQFARADFDFPWRDRVSDWRMNSIPHGVPLGGILKILPVMVRVL